MEKLTKQPNGSPTVEVVSGKPTVQTTNLSGALSTQTANVQQSPPSGCSKGAPAVPKLSRAQAEAKYSFLLDSTTVLMESLEAAVQAAPNTKTDIKMAIKSMGTSFRELIYLAKGLGIARSPDAIEQKVRALQQQQQQNHALTLEQLSAIRMEQARFQQQTDIQQGQHTTLVEKLEEALTLQAREALPINSEPRLNGTNAKLDAQQKAIAIVKEKQRLPAAEKRVRRPNAPRSSNLPNNRPNATPMTHPGPPQPPSSLGSATGEETPGVSKPSEWVEVAGRNRRSKINKTPLDLVRSRVPKGAAVTISKPAEGVSYADIMRKVSAEVKVKDLDVEPEARVTKSGSILLKVKDEQEAERLMDALNSAVGQMASVRKSCRTTPILILDLAEWHSPQDVSEAIAAAVPELAGAKVAIRVNPGGGRVGRLDAPLPEAVRLAEIGKLGVGWSRCRVKLLEPKEQTCYPCRRRGHIAASCSADEVKKRCFRCNSVEHLASACTITSKAKTKPNRQSLSQAEGMSLPAGGSQGNA